MEMRRLDPVVGRNSLGQIVMDCTNTSNPAISLRVVFASPEDAMRLADELAELANDHHKNDAAYPDAAKEFENERKSAQNKNETELKALRDWYNKLSDSLKEAK